MIEKFEKIIVLYGDSPFVSESTISNIIENNINNNSVVTMTSVISKNYKNENARFFDFGRVLRDEENNIFAIKEKKDCNETELKIKEGNAGYYCFDAVWLWQNLQNIKNNNVQNEYYLTDLVALAISQNEKVESVIMEASETFGINTLEQLEEAKKKLS
jgi:bifunctional UDP-N-acetylglucosamine pyrophosphorylase/glucosamine-1-phosphate N-acetyltransferase